MGTARATKTDFCRTVGGVTVHGMRVVGLMRESGGEGLWSGCVS